MLFYFETCVFKLKPYFFSIATVIEVYVQGCTGIQVVYPTDLYLSTILLQFIAYINLEENNQEV